MNITLAQLNYTVGDIAGNVAKILEAARGGQPTDLMVFSELCICGYPPEDLVLHPSFQEASMQAVEQLAIAAKELSPLLIGSIWVHDGNLYNAALLLAGGKIIHKQFKHLLPNYGVFDEKRVFSAGEKPLPIMLNNKKIGILICEDMWELQVSENLKGSEVICVLNGSPFEMDKIHQRREKATAITQYTNAPLVYVNQVGGQDEIVFDGSSFVMNADADVVAELPEWREAVAKWRSGEEKNTIATQPLSHSATIYQALVIGLRDYVNKNSFPSVLLGLSGGVDSALVAAIAADALGADRVRAVMLPSRYTSKDSLEDAQECAKLLGIKYETISIEPVFEQALSSLNSKLQNLNSKL
jgi:NAD+ synthase